MKYYVNFRLSSVIVFYLLLETPFNYVQGKTQFSNIFKRPLSDRKIFDEIISLRKENQVFLDLTKQLLKATQRAYKNPIIVVDSIPKETLDLLRTRSYKTHKTKKDILLKLLKNSNLRRDTDTSIKLKQKWGKNIKIKKVAEKKKLEAERTDGNQTEIYTASEEEIKEDIVNDESLQPVVPVLIENNLGNKFKDNSIVVVIDQNALDFDELIPPSMIADIKDTAKPKWWFFSQDDFKEFTSEETKDTRKFLFNLKNFINMLYEGNTHGYLT